MEPFWALWLVIVLVCPEQAGRSPQGSQYGNLGICPPAAPAQAHTAQLMTTQFLAAAL